MDGQPALKFADWALEGSRCPIARQYDDNSRVLLVEGDLPEGWSWTMLTACGDNLDLIGLSPMEGGVGAVLTAEMLALAGWYRMQLRGTMGEQTRHTNVVRVFIPESLSGDARWPEVPSEFSQAEERAAAAAKAAAESAEAAGKAAEDALEALDKAPRIQDGTWWVWDARTGAYMDTGAAARGEGVPETAAGDAGKFLQAGADGGQWADAPSDVVYVDSVAEGVNWVSPSPQPVSEDFTSKVQGAYDGHKVLFVHSELAGIVGTTAMTAVGQYGQNDLMYTGAFYLNNMFFGVSMIVDIDQHTILPSMFILEKGVDGEDGTTFTPSVSADGTLSWSNDGGLPNPDPVNIRGPAGTPGAQGEPGPATVVTVGDTITGEPGTDASVTSTPTEDGIQLGFTIPRGQDGAQGPAGAPGKDNLPNVSALSGGTQSLALEDNVEYRCSDALASLTVTGFDAPEAGKAGLWSIQFTAGAGLSVVLPDTSVWAVAEPVWTEGCIYWLSWTQLVDGRYLCVWVEVPGDG